MFGVVLAWLRKQVGQRTDAASSTGSLHAKAASIYALLFTSLKMAVASDALRESADTERNLVNTTSYTKKKEIVVNVSGIIRVKFAIKYVNANTGTARIYINGNAVGTERTATTSYVEFSEAIAVSRGDKVQIYLKNSASTSSSVSVKNFRLYWDLVEDDAMVTLD